MPRTPLLRLLRCGLAFAATALIACGGSGGPLGASSRDHVHTMQSVSKSVTSLVTGIASDMGTVNIDATVLSILPNTRTPPRIRA